MSSSVHSDLISVKSQSNLQPINKTEYSLNDQNIQINVTYSNGKPLHLKNIVLKIEDQQDFNDTILKKKEESYNNRNTFKWLEYIDPRKIPIAMMNYFNTKYDIITTSKLSSQFFLEKLIKQQRYMLVYCKNLGKYLLVYYKFNIDIDYNDTRKEYKLSEFLDKVEIKAVEISVANMLIQIYKNNQLILKKKDIIKTEYKNTFINTKSNTDSNNEFNFTDNNSNNNNNNNNSRHSDFHEDNFNYDQQLIENKAIETLKEELKDVNLQMKDIMNINNTLIEQNKAIKEQNDMILKLLKDKFSSNE